MSRYTKDEELDFYKRQPIADLLVRMGWTPKNAKAKPTKFGDLDAESMTFGAWKIQTFKGSSSHFLFKSHDGSLTTQNGKNVGTVVDIAVAMESGNLGRARQLLRSVTGYSPSNSPSLSIKTAPASESSPHQQQNHAPISSPLDQISTSKSAAELELEYKTSGLTWRLRDQVPEYLRSRNLRDLHPVFHETFRVSSGKYKNVIFPYRRFSDDGSFEIAGCEAKNTDFKGYSEGGHAGAWIAMLDDPTVVVVTESPIDAMSYARLMISYDNLSIGFLSVRSGGEQTAVDLISAMKDRSLRYVIIATDNDAAGMLYASKIMAGLHRQANDLVVRYEAPIHAQNDWNDSLAEDIRLKSGVGDQRRHDSVKPSFGGM